MQALQNVTNSSDSGWCPSCTCGWHKPIDAFDVTPPEAECRNTVCQCHQGFWDTDPVHVMPDEPDIDWKWQGDGAPGHRQGAGDGWAHIHSDGSRWVHPERSCDADDDELTTRRLWGDR